MSNGQSTPPPIGFQQVKDILNSALTAWSAQRSGQQPDLTGHGPTFSWNTKQELLNAVGHGKRLIQQEEIGTANAGQANLVLDLRTGLPLRMPKGGPFLDPAQIQVIEDWIKAGCPD